MSETDTVTQKTSFRSNNLNASSPANSSQRKMTTKTAPNAPGSTAKESTGSFNTKKVVEDLNALYDQRGDAKIVVETLSYLSTLTNVNLVPLEVFEGLKQLLERCIDNRPIIISTMVCISHFASFPRTRMMIGEVTGLIDMLLDKLNSFSQSIRNTALDALIQITEYNKNQVILIKHEETSSSSRGLMLIIALLQREDETTRRKCIQILQNLIKNELCVPVFVEDDILEPLLILLSNETYTLPENVITLEFATELFKQLSTFNDKEFCRNLVELGILDPCIRLIHLDQPSKQVRRNVIETLLHVTSVKDVYKKYVGESGGIEAVVTFLNSTIKFISDLSLHTTLTQQNELDKKDSTDLVLLCLTLINVLTEENVDTSKEILMENKHVLVSCGGLKTLLQLIGKNESDVVIELCIRIIGNVSIEDNSLKVLESGEGLVDTLLELLVESAKSAGRIGNIKKEYVIRAISSFGYYGQSVQKLVEMGVIEKLLQMVRDRVELSSVTEMFSQMNIHTSFQKIIYQTGGLKTLVSLLQTDKDDEFNAGIMSMMPFVNTPNGRLALKKEGVLDILKKFMQTKEAEVEAQVMEEENKKKEQREEERKKTAKTSAIAAIFSKIDPTMEMERLEKEKQEREKIKEETLSKIETYSNAKLMLKKALKDHDPCMRLGLEKAEPFAFDYDLLEKIEDTMVAECENRINQILSSNVVSLRAKKNAPKNTCKVQVNWRIVERIKDDEAREQYVALLSREAVWEEFIQCVEMFLDNNSDCIHAFNSQIRCVIVDVAGFDQHLDQVIVPSAETIKSVGLSLRDEDAMTLQEDLILRYSISKDGNLLSPKILAEKLSVLLLGYDITLYEDMDKVDEDYALEIENLQRVCRDTRIATIGDINILYFHLELGAGLFQAAFSEQQAITLSKDTISRDELFIKGWPIIKYNKNGLKQERILLLTDKSYYTVAFDYNSRKVDYGHCKHHSLEDFFICDIGILFKKERKEDIKNGISTSAKLANRNTIKNAPSAVQEFDTMFDTMLTSVENDDEDDDTGKKWALNLVTREAPHKQGIFGKKNNPSYVDMEQDEHSSDLNSVGDGEEDVLTETIKEEQDLMGGDEDSEVSADSEKQQASKRPNTHGMYRSIFIAPTSIPQNKQKCYLEEISWCFVAAASALLRTQVYEPFYAPVEKPSGNIANKLTKLLYNKLKFGISRRASTSKK